MRLFNPFMPVPHADKIIKFSQGKIKIVPVIVLCLVVQKGEDLLRILFKGLNQIVTNKDISGKPAVVILVDGAYIYLGIGFAGIAFLHAHRGSATGESDGGNSKQQKKATSITQG
jgi:hypothetical protein